MPNLTSDPILYHEFHTARYRAIDAILDTRIPRGGRVIELGCEPGHFARLALDCEWEYVGVSYHPSDAFRAEMSELGWELVDANLEARAELPTGFEFCLALEVIEHLPLYPLNLLLNAHGALEPGGTLIMTTPNGARVSSRFNALRGRSVHWPVRTTWTLEPVARHHREYTAAEVRELLSEAGFGEVTVRGLYQYGNRWKSRIARFTPSTLLGSLIATARR